MLKIVNVYKYLMRSKLTGISLLMVLPFLMYSCDGIYADINCKETYLWDYYSPDGNWKVVHWDVNCGAPSPYTNVLEILEADKSSTFQAEEPGIFLSFIGNPYKMEVIWIDNENVSVAGLPADVEVQFFKAKVEVGGKVFSIKK